MDASNSGSTGSILGLELVPAADDRLRKLDLEGASSRGPRLRVPDASDMGRLAIKTTRAAQIAMENVSTYTPSIELASNQGQNKENEIKERN